MSKKVVTFKMPVKDASRAKDGAQTDGPPNEEKTSPIARLAGPDADASSDRDHWVRNRVVEQAPAAALSTSAPLRTSVSIDLAAERNFLEIVALALSIPPLLGWFWICNSVSRLWASPGR